MKNVLMIAYSFPPLGGSGVQRIVKYAKYLPAFGWEPIILTVDEKRESQEITDTSLQDELPKGLKIYRSRYLGFSDLLHFPNKNRKVNSKNSGNSVSVLENLVYKFKDIARSLIIPDGKVGWYPFAIRKGKQIFNENNIDIIYSTSPFRTAHLIAMSLAKKYRKPWVADFRDPWTHFCIPKRFITLLKKWEEFMGKNVLRETEKIIIAWPAIQDNLISQYGDHCQKTVLIHNGFDEQDFQNIIPKTFKKFTIIHTGTFYKERSPEALFRAISSLLSKKPVLRNNIQIIFIGRKEPFIKKLIEENNLNDIVLTVPYLPHKECLSYLLGADMLFLNTIQNYVPGKTFEYLRSGKPILALVSNDTTVAEIVNSTKSGVVIDPTKTEEIKDAILGMYGKYKKGMLKLNREDDSVIYQYERKELTRKLAEAFNEIS
jgi:glycosyltransferase involved in cell wall biosynthesis